MVRVFTHKNGVKMQNRGHHKGSVPCKISFKFGVSLSYRVNQQVSPLALQGLSRIWRVYSF